MYDMRQKEIINVKGGRRYGFIADVKYKAQKAKNHIENKLDVISFVNIEQDSKLKVYKTKIRQLFWFQ